MNQKEKPSYPFTVWSGLLDPKHVRQMGNAVWAFLWCVNRTTREENGQGWVLGGSTIRIEDVASDLGISDRQIRRDFAILKEFDYIERTRTQYGYIIKINRSKRFKKEANEQPPLSEKAEAQLARYTRCFWERFDRPPQNPNNWLSYSENDVLRAIDKAGEYHSRDPLHHPERYIATILSRDT